MLCVVHRLQIVHDQKLPIPYFTYHRDEKSVLKVIVSDVESSKACDTLLATGTLIRVMSVSPVLPAVSVASITIGLLPATKEMVLFQEVVPLAEALFTLMLAIPLASDPVHTRVTELLLIN